MSKGESKTDTRFWKRFGWAAVLLLLFLLFLGMNHFTVATQDDYKYMLYTGESVGDVFVDSLTFAFGEHYMNWGGRAVAHFFAVFFLSLPGWIFHICNAAVSLFLLILLTRFVFPEGRLTDMLKKSTVTLLAVFLMLWFCNPDYPGTMLWVTGAANYLWGGVIILSFCLPYRRLLAGVVPKHPALWAVCMALWGVIAGWCNENTSGGGILLALLCMALLFYRRERVPVWCYTGIAGAAVGLFLMVSAPGNQVRSELEHDLHGKNFLMQLLRTLMRLPEHAVLLVIFAGLMVYLWPKHKKDGKLLLPAMLVLCALAMNFVMVFSPTFPSRAGFGVACMLIAANAILLSMVTISEQALKRALAVVLVLVCLGVAWESALFFGEASVIKKVYAENNAAAAQWDQDEPLKLNRIEALSPKSTLYQVYQKDDHYYREYIEKKYGTVIEWQGPLYDNWTTVAKLFLKG